MDVLHAPDSLSLARAFSVIGWTPTQAERRSRISRHRIARWLDGAMPDPDFVRWIADLEALHRRYWSPYAETVTPGANRPAPGAYEVCVARMTIGWSERQLAERSGIHRTELRRYFAGRQGRGWRLGRWLELLADGHRLYASPVTGNGAN
ncbi:MAG: helix-turn-helix transcriptional regulator [Gluconacetobacter sp.]